MKQIKVQQSIHLTPEIRSKIIVLAAQEDRSFANMVRILLTEALNNRE